MVLLWHRFRAFLSSGNLTHALAALKPGLKYVAPLGQNKSASECRSTVGVNP